MVKNVLILITKAEIGGAQQSVSYLSQELTKNGLNVTLAFGEGNFLQKKNEKTDINLVKLRHLRRTLNPLKNILLIFELKDYLEKHNTDILHLNSSNTLFCAIAAKISKTKPKVIFTFRGLSLLDQNYTRNPLKEKVILLIYKFLLYFVDTQVFVSNQNQSYARQIGIEKNSHVVCNGLPPLTFLPKHEAQEFFAKTYRVDFTNTYVIGSIGRLVMQKKYDFLIQQMQKLTSLRQNVILIIIGEGPDKEYYQKLIHDLELQERIYICEGIHDAYRYIKAFDTFVLCSLFEGMSITLLEALQAGLPILVSNVGGNAETLGNAGLLYSLNDANDFDNKIYQLIRDDNLRNELGKKAEDQFQHFSIKKTAGNYIRIYNL